MATSPTSLDTEAFDAFLEGLDYPVFVVTTTDGRERAGCLVGFTTQASIDPPRLLVCLSETNRTTAVALTADLLAVHVLDGRDHPLAALFGGETGDEVDKFADVGWHDGPGGVPLLDECPRYVVGRILERVPLGDHIGHLLAPIALAAGPGGDLLTFEDAADIEAGHPA
ncbi:flavin reductase family protein [Nocardioides sp. CER19]|uniref:flavin reductase family protein n=1 Tax=Nocardioides sp. CER19 TaxID=3038538 RepID=UPI002449A237|nr:flavin reductase family protein [Nocardioides sp. CER19]MDH2415699.1 flavin reductase family protein [Nocardioides sp. CER19]